MNVASWCKEFADTHRQDAAWFAPIFQQMRSGGYQAMLFDLLERDLRDWHPRQIVHTAALAEQQDESLSPLDRGGSNCCSPRSSLALIRVLPIEPYQTSMRMR